MSRRTLGTKSKGPVKPGNWGYGYQIERFNKEDIFDDDRENTWYDSCYNCVNCIGNICNKYNCTIRHLGSTKYRTCSSYKNIETSKNNIELELEKAYYDSLREWYEEGEETDIIAKEYRTKGARKNIIKNDTVNDICKAQRKIPKKDIMNLSYLSLKHNISVFSLFLEIGNEMKNKGNEHILQCKKQNNKYKYFDASKVFYEKINEIFNITDIDLLFLTKDKKRDIVYSFILSQNIVVRQISKNYYQYFIEDKDNLLNPLYFSRYDKKTNLAQFGFIIPAKYLKEFGLLRYGFKEYNVIYHENEGLLISSIKNKDKER